MFAGMETVLLVEDDAEQSLRMHRALRNTEAWQHLQIAESGEEAMEYLSGAGRFADRQVYGVPRLVLLRLDLSRRSGFEVLAWLRRQPTLHRLPVVILTESDNPEDINRAYDLGANAYLVKPGTFAGLSEMAKDLVGFWCQHNRSPAIPSEAGMATP